MWWKLLVVTEETPERYADEPEAEPRRVAREGAIVYLEEPPRRGESFRVLVGDPRAGFGGLRQAQGYRVLHVERSAVLRVCGFSIDPVARDAAQVGSLYVSECDDPLSSHPAGIDATPS